MKATKEKPTFWAVLGRVLTVAVLTLSLVFTLSLAASAEPSEGETAASDAESGFLDTALTAVREHLPLLLSALTLVGTGILARLFRSSLLPILDSTVRRVGGGVASLEEKTEEMLRKSEGELAALSALVSRLSEEAGGEAERLGTLRSELDGSLTTLAESLQLESARLDAVLLMLKEVFTAARLPAASKLALEEIYRKTPQGECKVCSSVAKTEGST